MRHAAGVLLLALVICSVSHPINAQNIQFTQGSVGAGLDNSIRIPIATYPGRGAASLPVTLYYSSKVWRIGYRKTVRLNAQYNRSLTEAIYAEHSAAGWTTSLDVPKVEWPKVNDLYWYDGKSYHDSVPPYTHRVANVFIYMPDGSTHELRKADQVYADNGTVDKVGTFYAVDGSRMRYDSTGEGTGTLFLPDGSRYVLNGADAQFIDRNGNTLNYDGSTRTWTDTLGNLRGEIAMPWPASPQAGANYNYTPPGFTSPYVFKWKSLSDALTPDTQGQTPPLRMMSDYYLPQPGQEPTNENGGNFPQPVASPTPTLFYSATTDDLSLPGFTYVVGRGQGQGDLFNPAVLAEVVLPNGLSYKFSYNVYGEIDKVVYPTGGYERTQYDTVPAMGNVQVPYSEASRGVKFRWVSPTGTGGADEAQWKYEPASGGLYSYLVKVTAPDGTRTDSYRHNFYNITGGNFGYQDARNGLPYDVRTYDSSGVMLRRELTEWAQTSASYTGPVPPVGQGHQSITYTAHRNARPAKSVSLILDTGGDALAKTLTHQYDTTYQFSTGLDRTGSTETPFAGVPQATAQGGAIGEMPAGPMASSSETTYENGQSYRDRYILGLVTSVVLKDAAGQAVSKTETFYDEPDYPQPTATSSAMRATPIRAARRCGATRRRSGGTLTSP